MNKLLAILSGILLTTALSSSANATTSVQFGVGYRSDDSKWKISTPDTITPITTSTLRFRDVEIVTLDGKVKGVLGDCVYLRAWGEYGWIQDGTLRESDTFALAGVTPIGGVTPFTVVYPAVHNDIDDKYVWDLSFGIGYPIHSCECDGLTFIPMLGFSYDTARYTVKDRNTVAGQLAPEQVVAFGLASDPTITHSKYRQTFWGPWLGFDLAYRCWDCWSLYGEFEWHWARVRLERNSNIGVSFIDGFERSKNANGFKVNVGGTFSFCCDWFVDGHVSYQQWHSTEHRLHINWKSLEVGVDLGFMF